MKTAESPRPLESDGAAAAIALGGARSDDAGVRLAAPLRAPAGPAVPEPAVPANDFVAGRTAVGRAGVGGGG